ncbi:class I SAM-dependent methyltransferase [Ekhidna sp.]
MLLPRLKFSSKPELSLNALQREAKKQIEEKLRQGVYTFESINCPICLRDDKELIGEKDRYGLSYITNICKSCGLVYTSPRMNEDSYSQFYDGEYRKLYVGTDKPTSIFFESQTRRGKKIHDFLLKEKCISTKKLSVLEVGCGAGGILEYFRSEGHDVMGIDLGAEYINYGKEKHDLTLHTGSLHNLDLSIKPDLVIYSHVLEHILDLNEELKLIKQISHQHTIIYIEVPGVKHIHKSYRSNILRYFQNAHTFHFSLESLGNIMKKNGFELISGNQTIQSIFKVKEHSPQIINDYDKIKNYIIYIEKKRKLYLLSPSGIKENLIRVILWWLRVTHTKKIASALKRKISKG